MPSRTFRVEIINLLLQTNYVRIPVSRVDGGAFNRNKLKMCESLNTVRRCGMRILLLLILLAATVGNSYTLEAPGSENKRTRKFVGINDFHKQ